MSPSPPYVAVLSWLWSVPFAVIVVTAILHVRLLRRAQRMERELRAEVQKQRTGRCPVCERLKRDHTGEQIDACLQRAQQEAAADGRVVLPVACPHCHVNGFLAMAARCERCGQPLVMGTMADVR